MNRVRRVAFLTLTLCVAACSDAPVALQTPQYAAQQSSKIAKYKTAGPQIGFVSKAIGPDGGVISLSGFEVVVPEGAVSEVTNFTIRLPSDGNNGRFSNYVWASFGPHGLRFNAPVTLKVPYFGTTADGEAGNHVMWFDGTDWVALPSTTTSDGRLQTQTSHFSDYGTEDTQKGINPVGG